MRTAPGLVTANDPGTGLGSTEGVAEARRRQSTNSLEGPGEMTLIEEPAVERDLDDGRRRLSQLAGRMVDAQTTDALADRFSIVGSKGLGEVHRMDRGIAGVVSQRQPPREVSVNAFANPVKPSRLAALPCGTGQAARFGEEL